VAVFSGGVNGAALSRPVAVKEGIIRRVPVVTSAHGGVTDVLFGQANTSKPYDEQRTSERLESRQQ
jgi:hypothetical protein